MKIVTKKFIIELENAKKLFKEDDKKLFFANVLKSELRLLILLALRNLHAQGYEYVSSVEILDEIYKLGRKIDGKTIRSSLKEISKKLPWLLTFKRLSEFSNCPENIKKLRERIYGVYRQKWDETKFRSTIFWKLNVEKFDELIEEFRDMLEKTSEIRFKVIQSDNT